MMATSAIHLAAPAANPLPDFTRMAREQIERLIEAAIAFCDSQDGDCDLEDGDSDVAADDVGEVEDWRPKGIVLPFPIYGDDQSRGPTNEAAVHRAFRLAQMQGAF